MIKRESSFQKKITKRLDDLIKEGYPLYYFVKEAGSIRGIPDLVLSVNGRFVVWEVKKSRAEAALSSGRIALQKYTMERVRRSHGKAYFVYPENFESCFSYLMKLLKAPLLSSVEQTPELSDDT